MKILLMMLILQENIMRLLTLTILQSMRWLLRTIVDQILREYGNAFDIGYDLTNMSNMLITAMPRLEHLILLLLVLSTIQMLSTNSTNQNNKLQVVNIADYQSAQKLSEKASTDFYKQSTTFLPSSNNTDSVIMTKLEKTWLTLAILWKKSVR